MNGDDTQLVLCDACPAFAELNDIEIVIVHRSDGTETPEAWCPMCLRDALRNSGIIE